MFFDARRNNIGEPVFNTPVGMGDTLVDQPGVARGVYGQRLGNIPRANRPGPIMVDPALVSVPNSYNLQRNGINYDVLGSSFVPIHRERIPDRVYSNGYPYYSDNNYYFKRYPYGRFPGRPYYTGVIPTYPSYAYNYIANDNPYLDPQYRDPYTMEPQYVESYDPRPTDPRSVATQSCLRRYAGCARYPNPNDCRACVINQSSPNQQNHAYRCADRVCGPAIA